MNIWFWLILMFLVLVIIFLILKIIIINNSLKDMIKQLRKKMLNTNNIIMTKTNNKKIKQLINDINKELQTLHDKEMQYQNGNQELYKSVTNISHDLRTPLTVIKGYTSLLEKESNTKKVKEYLKIISDKVCEMENLTELLFDYSRIIDIVDLIKLEKNCLNDILEEVLLSFYAIFKEKKIKPEININKEKIYCYVDKNSLVRIIENILFNAVKYTDGKINVTLTKNGEIIIQNKANFIDKTSLGRLFDRYFTVENGKRNSGVGLSIAKELVTINKGNIAISYKNNNLIVKVQFKS